MNSLTITLDPELSAWIDQEAKRTNSSLEGVVRQLIQRAFATNQQHGLYHDLDYLAGTWSDADVHEFLHATSDFNHIDEAMWS